MDRGGYDKCMQVLGGLFLILGIAIARAFLSPSQHLQCTSCDLHLQKVTNEGQVALSLVHNDLVQLNA